MFPDGLYTVSDFIFCIPGNLVQFFPVFVFGGLGPACLFFRCVDLVNRHRLDSKKLQHIPAYFSSFCLFHSLSTSSRNTICFRAT